MNVNVLVNNYYRILNTWNDSCTKLGLSLSKQIFNEFSKRINNAATKKTKAKLDLSGSNLDHQMVIILFLNIDLN